MRLGWKTFGGLIPKVQPRNLPAIASQTAQNCWLAETSLQPLKEPLTVQAITAGTESIYLWRRGGSEEWLSWSTDVNVVQGPIADDQYSRIYFTDGTTLHMNLWDNNAKVEVTDVSIAAPGAPSVTKITVFRAEYVRCFWGTAVGGSGSAVLEPKGFSAEGNVFKIKFHQSPSTPNSARMYWLTVNTNDQSAAHLPLDGHNTQEALFSDSLEIKSMWPWIANVFATFRVTGMESVQTTDQSTIAGVVRFGQDITFTCVVDSGRATTQYLYYAQTTVNTYGQESPPSPASTMVEWGPNEQLMVAATGAGRLYRSATGGVTSDFFFVAENPGSNYVDNAVDSSLAEKMPIMENPPTAMLGLVSMPGGFLAAFNGHDIYFSEPWLPYSWPTRYRLTVDFDVVGLAACGNDLIVMTKGNPYYITGTHPEIMSQTKLPVEQSCVSKRSICFSERFVCYASPDGLCTVAGGDVKIVTFPFYTRDQWQALSPQDMLGSVHEGRFMGFVPTGGIIIDFRETNATLSTTDQVATANYCDLENDALYLVQGTNITSWRAGVANLLAIWKTKEHQNVQDAIFTSAKVISDSYTNTIFKLFADGVQVWSYTVTDSKGFRVPNFDRSARWAIQLETQDVICELLLASSMMLLRSGDGIKE